MARTRKWVDYHGQRYRVCVTPGTGRFYLVLDLDGRAETIAFHHGWAQMDDAALAAEEFIRDHNQVKASIA